MKKNIVNKITGKVNKTIMAAGAALTTIATSASNVFASSTGFGAYTGADGNSIMNGLKTFVGNVGTYIGGAWLMVAIITLIMAVRNEDNEGRNKSLLNLVCSIALFSTGLIINLFMK